RRRMGHGRRGDPVRAVRTVQIAAKHPETVGERAGVRVEERLFLDRVALDPAHITPGDEQPPAAIEPHLAHADRAVGYGALMAAGVAANAAAVELFDQLRRRLARAQRKDFLESRHLSRSYRVGQVYVGRIFTYGSAVGVDAGLLVSGGRDPIRGFRALCGRSHVLFDRAQAVVTRSTLLPRHVLFEVLDQHLPPAAL